MPMIDFSCKKDILLEDEDGLLTPMSEPYFRNWLIAPGTWRVLSDGDYSYLLEGDGEALLIDTGYGAGDIREYCQSLTERPLRCVANTHDHFDHTANNSYFELAYLSAATEPLATRPFPSFEGVAFPKIKRVHIVTDGDVIPLKGRELPVFEIPDHAAGSLAFLDKKTRILFSGDEFMAHGKQLNGSVEHWLRLLEKLAPYRDQFDCMYSGGGRLDAALFDRQLACVRYILEGHEGEPASPQRFPDFERMDEQGRRVWKRRLPHPGDGPKDLNADIEYKRTMRYGGASVTYDIRRVHD